MDVNKTILIGRLTNDPVAKKLKTGVDVSSGGLATNRFWKDAKTKKLKNSVEFHNLLFFGSLASVVSKYLKKGDKIYVEGRLQTRKWEDKNKNVHYKTEIVVETMVMLGGKKAEESNREMAVEEIVVED